MDNVNIESVILFQIEKASKTAKQYSQREFDRLELGITVDQWVLLKIIEEAGTLSQKELAEKSMRDPASITRTLDILNKKGLVSRESIPDNRRQYKVLLTQAGSYFVKNNMELITKHRKQSINGFKKEELENLRNYLIRIQENLK
jgi:DNA-binding MarR family transcriptional regulator